VHAAADQTFNWDNLADFVAGTATPPKPGIGIVLFESQGVALHDLAITALAHQRSEH